MLRNWKPLRSSPNGLILFQGDYTTINQIIAAKMNLIFSLLGTLKEQYGNL